MTDYVITMGMTKNSASVSTARKHVVTEAINIYATSGDSKSRNVQHSLYSITEESEAK